MTITLLTAVLLLSQTTAAPSPPTMTGCVDAKRTVTGAITFTEKDTGHTYQLTGKGLAKYLGQQVEVVGGTRRRLTIRGGLVPSANAAAQAGALDPAQESIARQPGGGGSGTNAPPPEFPVTRVRALTGTCPR